MLFMCWARFLEHGQSAKLSIFGTATILRTLTKPRTNPKQMKLPSTSLAQTASLICSPGLTATITRVAGDDAFLLGMNAVVTGGEGADTFTLLDRYVSTEITDFDPDEDVIAITLPPGYAGAGDITLRANANDTTPLQVDGLSYATLSGTLTDTTGIVTLTSP